MDKLLVFCSSSILQVVYSCIASGFIKSIKSVGYPSCDTSVARQLKFDHGFFLHGPGGCGKTLLANAIAGVSAVHMRETKNYGVAGLWSTCESSMGNQGCFSSIKMIGFVPPFDIFVSLSPFLQ